MWVKGSGSDLATMEREHFTPLRLEEMLPLFERDEMSDEDMVAHLARCQTRPGGAALRRSRRCCTRSSRPTHVHHTHPDAINVLAGTRDGERLVARVLRRRGRVDPVHPARASRSPSRSARRCARTRACKLVVLAKHGLVVWGDTAEEAYRRTIEVINRAADFVNAQTAGDAAVRRRRAAARRRATSARRCCARCCPALRGAVSSERPKVLVVDTSPRVARVRLLARRAGADRRSAPRARTTSCTPSACRCGSRSTRRPRTRRAARAGPRARGGVPRRVPRVRRAPRATTTTEPADPDARVVLIQHVGLVGVGADAEERAAVARPLPPRDRGDGRRARARRLHVARRGRELRGRVLAARALQAVARAAAGRAAGHGRARDRRGRRHRARGRRRARRGGRVRRRASTSTARARPTRSRTSATRARRSPAT